MKIFKPLFILLSGIIILSGCKKDKEETLPPPKPKDVYVAGYQATSPFFRIKAVYYKNSVLQLLNNTFNESIAKDVFVSDNNDVYVAGEGDGKAVYWKNNTLVVLNDLGPGLEDAVSVFVSGADVYVCGSDANSSRAVFWKNGTPIFLTAPDPERFANSIFVNSNDMYIAGHVEIAVTGESRAVYWKNGSLVYLNGANFQTDANSIIVNGTDIYVA